MIGTTLMGIGVIAVLSMNMVGVKPILIAAAVGFVLAIPASWYVAREITKRAPGG